MAEKAYRNDSWSTTIIFQNNEIPRSVWLLNPIIFSDAPEAYCCYLGSFATGIVGCGKTVLEAMHAFDEEFQKKLKANEIPDWLYYDEEKLKKAINGKKKGTKGRGSKAA